MKFAYCRVTDFGNARFKARASDPPIRPVPQFVKSFLDRRVPSPCYPALWHRVFFLVVFNVVLLVGSSIESRVVEQVRRHVDYAGIKRGILKLDEQLLAL